MRVRNEEVYQRKKEEIMVKCFDCYAESGVGLSTVAKACGYNKASLYNYFTDLDELIVESTEYCMSKVEDDFMTRAPKRAEDLERFIDEIPYWTAEKHGKKYRLMYQIYTHPKYIEYGKKFFEGVNQRYTEYAKSLEDKVGIPCEILTPLIFILVRTSVHYALFEDEFYLKAQMNVLKQTVKLFWERFHNPDEAEKGV